jgi:hypothetical protein
MSLITADSLIWVSSSNFSARCFSLVRSWVKVRRQRHRPRSSRCHGGGTSDGRTMPRSASRASHTASSLSVFGLPGTFLTSRALTSQHSVMTSSST